MFNKVCILCTNAENKSEKAEKHGRVFELSKNLSTDY